MRKSCHEQLQALEAAGILRRPIVPHHCQHNAHMYYVILPPEIHRPSILAELKRNHVNAVSHYVPLHSSPAGRRYGKIHGDLRLTDSLSEAIIRLPLWVGLTHHQQDTVIEQLTYAIKQVS